VTDRYEQFTRMAWLAVPISIIVLIVIFCSAALWLRADLKELHPAATDAPRVLRIVGGAATDIEKALKQEREASTAQIQATAQLQGKANAAADNLAKLVQHTDDSLNGTKGVLPVLSGAIAEQNVNMTKISVRAEAAIDTLDVTVADLQPVLAAAATAAQNGADLSGDPAIKQALQRLDDAIAQSNDVLQHLDAIAASGDRDAAMLETRLREALKPASLAKTIFMRTLGLAGPAAQVATAAK